MTCQAHPLFSLLIFCSLGGAFQAKVEVAFDDGLITLIFADRALLPACIIVIRRELPLTRNAGPVANDLSHRSWRGFSFPRAMRPLPAMPHHHSVLDSPGISCYAAPFALCAV